MISATVEHHWQLILNFTWFPQFKAPSHSHHRETLCTLQHPCSGVIRYSPPNTNSSKFYPNSTQTWNYIDYGSYLHLAFQLLPAAMPRVRNLQRPNSAIPIGSRQIKCTHQRQRRIYQWAQEPRMPQQKGRLQHVTSKWEMSWISPGNVDIHAIVPVLEQSIRRPLKNNVLCGCITSPKL